MFLLILRLPPRFGEVDSPQAIASHAVDRIPRSGCLKRWTQLFFA